MRDTEALLGDIHYELCLRLLDHLQNSKEIKPSMIKEARELLKDSGITARPTHGSPIESLANIEIPFEMQLT